MDLHQIWRLLTKLYSAVYVILPFHAIKGLIDDGYVKTIDKGKRYRATFAKKDGKIFLARKDVKRHVDNWDSIK